MRPVRLATALATLALALPACEPAPEGPVAPPAPASAHHQDGVVDFNDLTLWRASFPGSGDLQIYAGTTTGSDDGFIFDFADGSIIGRTSPSSGTPDDDDDDVAFGEIARVVGHEILDPQDNVICRGEVGDLIGTFRLRAAGGEVLFTLIGTLVFEGDVSTGDKGFAFVATEDRDPLYSYLHVYIHAGWWPRGEVLATATENTQLASPMRHLVIAAMMAGKCGSLGIDPAIAHLLPQAS